MADLEAKRRVLNRLLERLGEGEISRDEYRELVAEVSAGLGQQDLIELGVTPTPHPQSGSGIAIGPSGGRTRMPSIAELEIEPGTVVLDQWRIVRELGRGGFGAVFEAEDIKLGRTLAVKVLDPAMAAKEELLARFRREVTLMRELAHDRIVRVYDYREDAAEHLALITMEYVRGCSVAGVLALARASGELVPVTLALAIFEQTLQALAAAHAQGVIHRDVTPGNILLAGGTAAELMSGPECDPRVKLVDFGIAGLVKRSELSAKSRVLGTAAYVAPEVLDPDAEITAGADVFGAGAVAYDLLTGKTPMVTGYRPVRTLRAEVAAGTGEVVDTAVSPVPGERPSASEALGALANKGAPPEMTPRFRTQLVVDSSGRRPGDLWTDPVLGMRFRYIPAGCFEMGSAESKAGRKEADHRHEVALTRGFWMGETEVTQGQWRAVMGTCPASTVGTDDLPMENLTWYQAVCFANLLSERAGLIPCYRITGDGAKPEVQLLDLERTGFRLPTEAEWEFAARAGGDHRFAGGDDLAEVGWYAGNSSGATHPVGRKPANAWGLHDMSGNVWEWCWDWYGEYPSEAATDPIGPSTYFGAAGRVRRGGSWGDSGAGCRTTSRDWFNPGARSNGVGLRLVRTAVEDRSA